MTMLPPVPARRRFKNLRRDFERALPRIRLHARIAFRGERCNHRRDDCVSEVIALAWQWWLRLKRRGKDPSSFVSAIAKYAARAVRSGRRVCGQERANDVLSPRAQQNRGFTVSPLPSVSSLYGNVFDEALHDNTQTPVVDQAAFRCDFPAWLLTRTDRERRIVGDMLLSERTSDLADKYGLTAGRVSQMRREFHRDWHVFHGEAV